MGHCLYRFDRYVKTKENIVIIETFTFKNGISIKYCFRFFVTNKKIRFTNRHKIHFSVSKEPI